MQSFEIIQMCTRVEEELLASRTARRARWDRPDTPLQHSGALPAPAPRPAPRRGLLRTLFGPRRAHA